MSSVNFAILDLLFPGPLTPALIDTLRRSARAGAVIALASGAGGGNVDCLWHLFSIYYRPVRQLIFSSLLATTISASA